jgi:hypothetical protein
MNKEETLLTSDKSQEVPKIKLALEEKYEKEKEDKIDSHNSIKEKETDKLPQPTGWRILVLPFKTKKNLKVEYYTPTNLLNDLKLHRLVD